MFKIYTSRESLQRLTSLTWSYHLKHPSIQIMPPPGDHSRIARTLEYFRANLQQLSHYYFFEVTV